MANMGCIDSGARSDSPSDQAGGTVRLSPRRSLRDGLILLLATIAGPATLDAAAGESHSQVRPNFVLCMADDQGWGEVGYRDGGAPVVTPSLDAMAAHGLRLDRFYAAAPVCSPTRGSVLTGRHPNRFGDFQWGFKIRPQEVTIAEALKAAGYATGHFGKWHLGSVRAGDPTSPGENGFETWLSSPNFYDNDPLMSREGTVIPTEGESSMVAVKAALEFIREAKRDGRPFLAIIWFGSPHLPHQADPATREPYAGLPEAVQNYYGEISGIDRAMGRLRDELRQLDLADETLLWYTSDNGPRSPKQADRAASTGGLRGIKGTLWEGGLRVPAILEWPSVIPEGRRSEVPCGTVDIFPTLLDLAGVAPPDNSPRPRDGISLRPLIDGSMTRRDKPLGFWNYPIDGKSVRSTEILQEMQAQEQASGPVADAEPTEPEAVAITVPEDIADLPGHAAWIEGRFKLHRQAGQDEGVPRYTLYDLAADPAETADLAAREPKRVDRMKADLETWQRSVVQSLKGEDYQAKTP